MTDLLQDNPFAEPDDGDHTIIRPMPGGRPKGGERRVPPPDLALGGGADETLIAPRAPRNPASRRQPAQPAELPASSESPLLAAAAPLLQLLARLRNTLTPPDAGDLRHRTAEAIRQFEREAQANGVPPDQLRPAHFALCASLDDVVLNTPWGSEGDWASQSLVSSFHNEVRGGEQFFVLLLRMQQHPAKFMPVLELIYLCLSLGFMGRYRLSPRGRAEIDQLREELYAAIAAARSPTDVELSPTGKGSPRRIARYVCARRFG